MVWSYRGGDPTQLFEPVEGPLHEIAQPIDIRVESRRAATGRAFGLPVSDLVGALPNDRSNAT